MKIHVVARNSQLSEEKRQSLIKEIKVSQSNCCVFVRCKECKLTFPEYVLPVMNHGGGVIVWERFCL